MSSNDTTLVSKTVDFIVYMPYNERTSLHPFTISESARVEDLVTLLLAYPGFKKALKDEDPYLFKYGEPCGTDENSYQRVTEWLHTKSASDKMMKPRYRLAKYFPEGPAPEAEDVIDIVVATNTILGRRDILYPLSDRHIESVLKGKASLVNKMAQYPRPSLGIQSEAQIWDWLKEDGVHYHRPALNYGPSTALFHPAIAKLWYRLKHLDRVQRSSSPSENSPLHIAEPSAEYLGWVHRFIQRSCDAYSREADRALILEEIINYLVCEPGTWRQVLASRVATPDVMWMSGLMVRAIMEIKNVDGISGNASLQCLLDYAKVLTQSHYADYTKSSNLPVILIGLMGTRLEISTAVFTDGIYADKVLSEDFIVDARLPDAILRLGYIFTAISLALRELRSFYSDLTQTEVGQKQSLDHMFPDPVPDPDCPFSIPTLNYIGKLTHSGTVLDERDPVMVHRERPHALYRAKMEREGVTTDVVVKFVIWYNEKAHRILAEKELAPTLHYCIPVIGDMYMVIMDYVEGETLFALGNEKVKTGIDDLKVAIELLHEQNLVYGDLRPQNVIRKASGGLMLVDFDWSGVHQEDRYPASLNMQNSWAPGVGRRTLMDKAHDLFMLERLAKKHS